MPTTLVTVEPPKIPKLQAVPNPEDGAGHAAEVVNVHTKLAASVLPNVSAALVVMVAVKAVLGAELAVVDAAVDVIGEVRNDRHGQLSCPAQPVSARLLHLQPK